MVFYIPADLPRVGTVSEALTQQCAGALSFQAAPFPLHMSALAYEYATGAAIHHATQSMQHNNRVRIEAQYQAETAMEVMAYPRGASEKEVFNEVGARLAAVEYLFSLYATGKRPINFAEVLWDTSAYDVFGDNEGDLKAHRLQSLEEITGQKMPVKQ